MDGSFPARSTERSRTPACAGSYFKTSVHEGGGLDEFLDNELRRYRTQLERYAVLLSAMDERPVRLGLYFPLLGGWREWSDALGNEDERLADRERTAGANP